MAGIYEGIKVLDLSRVIAGPLCTQMLGDAGATVYKIERPNEGDDTRRMGPFLKSDDESADQDRATTFLAYNRSKQSVTVDIADPEGAELVRALATKCDVFVENFKAGGLSKYGLDYENIRKLNPGIIYCSISGYGQSGPYAKHVAYDFILQGMAGLMSTCGQPDGTPGAEPMRTSIPITDIVTGLYAHSAVVGALFHRLRTGEGQYIDTSLLDASVSMNGHLAVSYLNTGLVPGRAGNSNPIAAPSEVFECSDGHLIVAAGNDRQFKALCQALGCATLASDVRFRTNAARVANRSALKEYLSTTILVRKRAELLRSFRSAGVPSGPINTMQDVFSDPQVQHKGLDVQLPYGPDSEVHVLRNPLRFSQAPVSHRPPPRLGEHTESVLVNELGLTTEAVAALRDQGVI